MLLVSVCVVHFCTRSSLHPDKISQIWQIFISCYVSFFPMAAVLKFILVRFRLAYFPIRAIMRTYRKNETHTSKNFEDWPFETCMLM